MVKWRNYLQSPQSLELANPIESAWRDWKPTCA